VLDVERSRGAIELVLANVGDEPAYDVTVSFRDALPGPNGEGDLSELPLFRLLALLRQGRELRVLVGGDTEVAGRNGSRIDATVRWRGKDGREGIERIVHDLSIFRNWPERC
jgi:hypothetical protein